MGYWWLLMVKYTFKAFLTGEIPVFFLTQNREQPGTCLTRPSRTWLNYWDLQESGWRAEGAEGAEKRPGNTSESFFGIRSLESVGIIIWRCDRRCFGVLKLWALELRCEGGVLAGCIKDGPMRQVSRNKGDTNNRDFNGENQVLLLNHGIAFFLSFSDKARWLAIWFPFYHYAITLW